MTTTHKQNAKKRTKVAVIGTSGHGSAELIALLATHPCVVISALVTGNKQNAGKSVAEVRPELDGVVNLKCELLEPKEVAERCDVVITTTPPDVALRYLPSVVAAGKKCVDFSAAYRLRNGDVFAKHYGFEHPDPANLSHAVYGLPEFFRDQIRGATLVANPGCYPTAAAVGVVPALKAGVVYTKYPIIGRAVSGYSGAGAEYEPTSGVRPYKIANHRHAPEIAQLFNDCLKMYHGQTNEATVSFAPRINDDMDRGIDSDASMLLKENVSERDLRTVFRSFYASEPLVEVVEEEPDVKNIVGKSGAQVAVWKEGDLLHTITTIDNLQKGAASQAVQNLNLMCGFGETSGLDANETTAEKQ